MLFFSSRFLQFQRDCWSSCFCFFINQQSSRFTSWTYLEHILPGLMRKNCILCLKLAIKSRGHFAWESRIIVRKELPHFVGCKYLCIKFMKRKEFSIVSQKDYDKVNENEKNQKQFKVWRIFLMKRRTIIRVYFKV